MKPYCTQNTSCSTCSLVNYNRDCRNNPVQGGYRDGAGRKPTGRKRLQFYVTDAEAEQLKQCLISLRKPSE
jgi:hypothetical protein